ncbi:MAG: lipopolysaccharide assembly protein LapA domain-containing protein [Gammaproteobacteria bacterium]
MSYIFNLLKILFFLAIGGLVLGFSLLNAGAVEIHYYWGQVKLPLAILLALAFVLGALVTALILSCKILGLKLKRIPKK